MSLPDRTTVLIVGAGPSGLATAISLIQEGCHDIVVVDALAHGENTSRALIIHAATLEALDSIGCAEPLIKRGIKCEAMTLRDRWSPLFSIDFNSLAKYTKFPFALLLPQNITEDVLKEKLESLGVRIVRPLTLTGMKASEDDPNTVDVSFQDGQRIKANYVIGTDGARSAVRQIVGIGFKDPEGSHIDETTILTQMVLGDIVFDRDPEPTAIPTSQMTGVVSDESIFILMALAPSTTSYKGDKQVYRIITGVPVASGVPPHAPPIDYLQNLVNKHGPVELSSNPDDNSKPVKITEVLWSTRFRTHSAIADKCFTRFAQNESSSPSSGVPVALVGDAAHIHSPAGGQGMNLGLRDAISLGPIVAAHVKQSQSQGGPATDEALENWASTRHSRALKVITLTKRLLSSFGSPGASTRWWLPFSFGTLRYIIVSILNRLPIAKNAVAWRLSGLGNP